MLQTTRITTSRRQVQGREDLCGGSPSAKARADEQKLHRRPGLRASWHLTTKPSGCSGQGKCSGCARKVHALTWGDLSGVAMQGEHIGVREHIGVTSSYLTLRCTESRVMRCWLLNCASIAEMHNYAVEKLLGGFEQLTFRGSSNSSPLDDRRIQRVLRGCFLFIAIPLF